MLTWEDDIRLMKHAVREFWARANKRIHATVEGLAEEFGLSIDYLVPDDFEEAYSKAGHDFDAALELYVLLNKYQGDATRRRYPVARSAEEFMSIPMGVWYHKPTITDLALFAFYIAHRLLDLTTAVFHITDDEFVEEYRTWHQEVRKQS